MLLPDGFRENADTTLVCPHRDLSVCPACAASDPRITHVLGVHYFVPDPIERALLARLADPATDN